MDYECDKSDKDQYLANECGTVCIKLALILYVWYSLVKARTLILSVVQSG